jgi:hypothetical protein
MIAENENLYRLLTESGKLTIIIRKDEPSGPPVQKQVNRSAPLNLSTAANEPMNPHSSPTPAGPEMVFVHDERGSSGPYALAEVRQWEKEGLVSAATLYVCREGETEWKLLRDV